MKQRLKYQSKICAVINPIKVLDELDITLVQNPRLTGWENKFVVFRCDSSVQAFIRQEEKDVEIQAIAEGSELEFKEGKHWYGVDIRIILRKRYLLIPISWK